MDKSEVQAILDEAIPVELERLGLSWWRLVFALGPTDLGPDYNAVCFRLPNYDRARITLDPEGLDSKDEVISTLRHELLHLIHAPFDLVESQLAEALSDKEFRVLAPLWRYATEQTVRNLERMFRGLTEQAIQPPQKKGIPIMSTSKSKKNAKPASASASAPNPNASPNTPAAPAPAPAPAKGGKRGGKKGC